MTSRDSAPGLHMSLKQRNALEIFGENLKDSNGISFTANISEATLFSHYGILAQAAATSFTELDWIVFVPSEWSKPNYASEEVGSDQMTIQSKSSGLRVQISLNSPLSLPSVRLRIGGNGGSAWLEAPPPMVGGSDCGLLSKPKVMHLSFTDWSIRAPGGTSYVVECCGYLNTSVFLTCWWWLVNWNFEREAITWNYTRSPWMYTAHTSGWADMHGNVKQLLHLCYTPGCWEYSSTTCRLPAMDLKILKSTILIWKHLGIVTLREGKQHETTTSLIDLNEPISKFSKYIVT